jgi:eukaryotic-like serine/threonine-protein kinase
MSDSVQSCAECGGELPAHLPPGLCPRCALSGVLESTLAETPAQPAPEVGERIGHYKLLEKIGEGGCGVVYMAEQEEPVRRRVALKVIKLGMDTREVIARFEAERQALALMEHPHIAKIFDGGATGTGRPYFVMELVRGLRITDYCDQKNLSTRQRLDLFMQVCQAVQHAHQKGIIHRDLKPSNILVTVNDGVPMPKVIDFGIAKATGQRLTDKTLFTRFQQIIGTPAYMSPEQTEMTSVDIDTRSDIYSLGVLLYELLTGRTPFDAKKLLQSGVEELLRTIREQEPVRPSARLITLAADEQTTVAQQRHTDPPRLVNLVRGDLDWIVMKCLEKDRARRYETASGLAKDLQRHLVQEPVIARPPNTAYRAQKFIRRNKGLVAATSTIALALLLGFAVSLWQWRRAEVARGGEALQRREAEARAAAERMAKEDASQQRTNAVRAAEQAKANAEAADKANADAQREKRVAQAARREAEQEVRRRLETLTQIQIQRAEDFFAANDSPRALAYLASVLANDPSNAVAAERLLSALNYRNFGLPLTEPLRHERSVHSAEFSPDGLRVVTASEDHTARVWDAQTGKSLTEPLRHERSVHSAQFSPDGLRVLTASKDNTARVWDAQTGQPLTEPLRHERGVHSAQFSPDGLRVVTTSEDNTARVWDARTGKPLTELLRRESRVSSPQFSEPSVHAAQFSPEGLRVVTASYDRTARVWDAQTGKALTETLQHKASVHSAQFSPDGLRLVTAAYEPVVRVWDTQTGKPLAELRHESWVTSARFSPDGLRLITASEDKTAQVWDGQTGKPITEVLRHERNVRSARFSPDGLQVVTASDDNTARVWDAQSGRPLSGALWHEGSVYSAQFSPDGQRLVTASEDKTARVWDVRSGIPLSTLFRREDRVRSAQFSPDGLRVVTAYGKTARVWDAQTGKALTKPLRHEDSVVSVQLSADGRVLATASDKMVQLWDAQTGEPRTKPFPFATRREAPVSPPSLPGTNLVKVLARPAPPLNIRIVDDRNDRGDQLPLCIAHFSPDGLRVVVASDEMARVWDVQTGKPVTEPLLHKGRVRSAQFSPDGLQVVTTSEDKTARLWDAQSGKSLAEPLRHEGAVKSAQFSSDGLRVVTASADKTARIWNARNGKPVADPLQHEATVHFTQFSHDGLRVVTASEDKTARVWDARTGKPVTEPLRHADNVVSVQFSPDGLRVATASSDKTARVWDAETGKPLSEPLRHESSVSSARFSPDGSRLVTTSNRTRVWDLRFGSAPVPPWLPQLAVAVVGKRLTEAAIVEPVASAEFLRLKEELNLASRTNWSGRWAQWFLADRSTRTISPFSSITIPEYLQLRMEENTRESLDEAIRLSPTNGIACARFARKILAQDAGDNPRRLGEADFFSRRALEFAPNNPEVQRIRADVLEQINGTPKL